MNGWEGLRSFLEKGLRGMGFSFCSSIGIDLGTANTLVYMKGKGIILREPSVVAVEAATGQPRCFGSEAKAVIGRTPESILAVRPLRQGVIADFDVTAAMLSISTGVGIIMVKQRRGLHSKKTDKGVFVYATLCKL